MSDTWLLIGSGPDAPEYLPVAMADYPDAITMTTNHGLNLIEKPDYYLIIDRTAVRLLGERAKKLQSEGMYIVTSENDCTRPVVESVIPNPDYHFIINNSHWYMKGFISRCRFSGLYMLQFVLLMGAERVAMVGYNGYPPDKTPYWYEHTRKYDIAEYRTRTLGKIQPYMHDITKANPDVHFVYYGKLNYEVSGKNVTRVQQEVVPA